MQDSFYASSYAAKIIFADRSVFYASVWTHKIVTMTNLKQCKYNLNSSSHAAKRFLSRTYNPLYVQEQGCYFF